MECLKTDHSRFGQVTRSIRVLLENMKKKKKHKKETISLLVNRLSPTRSGGGQEWETPASHGMSGNINKEWKKRSERKDAQTMVIFRPMGYQ